jgi:hypothetical protein
MVHHTLFGWLLVPWMAPGAVVGLLMWCVTGVLVDHLHQQVGCHVTICHVLLVRLVSLSLHHGYPIKSAHPLLPPITSPAPAGTLPPSWGALSKLRECSLWNNTLSGPLPSAWSGMAALQELQLQTNALAGTVPPSLGSWGQLRSVFLYANPQLRGCIPSAWRGKVNVGDVVKVEGPYKGGDLITAGTNITGFC